jgi:hypothetical protein
MLENLPWWHTIILSGTLSQCFDFIHLFIPAQNTLYSIQYVHEKKATIDAKALYADVWRTRIW